MNCGNLIRSSDKCLPPSGGVDQILLLIDRKKFLSYIRNAENDAIENFLTTEKGFYYKGIRASLSPTQEIAADAGINFVHSLTFLILEISNAQKKNVQNMTRGRYVAIIENRDKSNDSVFEVYGLNYGLEVQSGVLRGLNDSDTSAAWQINLSSTQEPLLPDSIWTGDYNDSKALIISRILSHIRYDFKSADGGFLGDASGTVLWNYSNGWNVLGLINGDISEILSNEIEVGLEKNLYNVKVELSSIGPVLGGSVSLEVLINGVVLNTYFCPDFDTLLDDEFYFHHKESLQPETIGFRATFADVTNSPTINITALDIALIP